MVANKKLSPIVIELFLRGTSSTFHLILYHNLKTIRLNVIHYYIMKILIKTELQQIPSNYSPDIEFIYFIKL